MVYRTPGLRLCPLCSDPPPACPPPATQLCLRAWDRSLGLQASISTSSQAIDTIGARGGANTPTAP